MVARDETVYGNASVKREWEKWECEGKKVFVENKQEGLKE